MLKPLHEARILLNNSNPKRLSFLTNLGIPELTIGLDINLSYQDAIRLCSSLIHLPPSSSASHHKRNPRCISPQRLLAWHKRHILRRRISAPPSNSSSSSVRTRIRARRRHTPRRKHIRRLLRRNHFRAPRPRILVTGIAAVGRDLDWDLEVQGWVAGAGCVGAELQGECVDAADEAGVEGGEEVLILGKRDGDSELGGVEAGAAVGSGGGQDAGAKGGGGRVG